MPGPESYQTPIESQEIKNQTNLENKQDNLDKGKNQHEKSQEKRNFSEFQFLNFYNYKSKFILYK
jgi:hypothetical protein